MKNVVKFLSIFILLSCSPSKEELELKPLGDWRIANYVDEWGDDIDTRFIELRATGDYDYLLHKANLVVQMILSHGRIDKLHFRFYPYGSWGSGKSSRNGSNYDTYFLRCRVKAGNKSNIFPIYLYQEPGKRDFYIGAERLDDTKTKDASAQKLINLIQNEDIAKFLCREEGASNDLYRFDLNFKYFSNAQRKYALGDD